MWSYLRGIIVKHAGTVQAKQRRINPKIQLVGAACFAVFLVNLVIPGPLHAAMTADLKQAKMWLLSRETSMHYGNFHRFPLAVNQWHMNLMNQFFAQNWVKTLFFVPLTAAASLVLLVGLVVIPLAFLAPLRFFLGLGHPLALLISYLLIALAVPALARFSGAALRSPTKRFHVLWGDKGLRVLTLLDRGATRFRYYYVGLWRFVVQLVAASLVSIRVVSERLMQITDWLDTKLDRNMSNIENRV